MMIRCRTKITMKRIATQKFYFDESKILRNESFRTLTLFFGLFFLSNFSRGVLYPSVMTNHRVLSARELNLSYCVSGVVFVVVVVLSGGRARLSLVSPTWMTYHKLWNCGLSLPPISYIRTSFCPPLVCWQKNLARIFDRCICVCMKICINSI